ncbi:capsule biosynthesis protein [Sphingobium nicotianae]|nr:capsule biosynthesis protein [Sphingobium nicotianae]
MFVLLPTLAAGLYYYLFAADQFISESRFIVKSQSRSQSAVSPLASLLQTTGLSAGQEQTSEVISYIKSRDALTQLAKTIPIRTLYQLPSLDFLGRYPAPFRSDRFENLYRYYGDMISVHTDQESGLAILSVRAFTPQDARKINLLLLDQSEQLVNRLNAKARDNAISEARKRVIEAETRVKTARIAMTEYRNEERLLDPAKQAGGVLEMANKLAAEQAALQARLETMERMAPKNPSIPALRRQIQALAGQSAIQSGRVVGNQSAISSKLGGYEALAMEQEFAAQTLTAANASLEQARAEAQRQQFYLERVVEPTAPDMSRFPNRLNMMLTIFGTALCLYFIGWMLVVGVLEHSPDR